MKTTPGRVDNAGCVVVGCDTMWCTICEAMAVINSIVLSSGVVNGGMLWTGRGGGMGLWCWKMWGGNANWMSIRLEVLDRPWRHVDRRPLMSHLRILCEIFVSRQDGGALYVGQYVSTACRKT